MARKKFNPIIPVVDDGLYIPEVGPWSEEKYKLLGAYCEIFTSGMKNLWDSLVYIDLFAGAGYAKIKNTNKIWMSSALVALSVGHKFNKYILCEEDEKCMNALKSRVGRHFPDANVEFVQGDTNEGISEIIQAIPKHSAEDRVLRFCFADPFSLNLRFSTIEQLSKVGKIDFLILLALYMDANRNLGNYISENSKKVDLFIGDESWRELFLTGKVPPQDFIKYLASKYDLNMKKLSYEEPTKKHLVRLEGVIPLYYLAFYQNIHGETIFFKKLKSI